VAAFSSLVLYRLGTTLSGLILNGVAVQAEWMTSRVVRVLADHFLRREKTAPVGMTP
jgi:hypothetical protein